MQEVYKPIKGYEGLYEVSNLGNVKSLSKIRGRAFTAERLLKPRIVNGYVMVTLCKESKRFNASVHRLIAEAFIPNPENKETINHIDGNKQNNSIDNLEWATQRENNLHAYRTGLHDPKKNGRTGKRRPRTEEEKRLISLKTKEAMKNPGVISKMKAPRPHLVGCKRSEETKRKMREAWAKRKARREVV